MENKNEKSSLSVLKLKHVVFDRLLFERYGFQKNGDVQLKVGVAVNKSSEGEYRVSLKVEAIKNDEYTVEVTITGYFTIDENYPQKEDILKKNTVSILFPYVRSELTLLTAQPDTEPIVLPALNINAIIDNSCNSENS